MSDGIYAALSGAIAHQTSLETTATNLANASTTGYRAIRPVFHEVLAREAGPGEPIHFSAVRSTAVDATAGGVKHTARPLDIALGPESFLAVDTQGGERFTRAGALKVAPNGTLTTQLGHPVLSEVQERIQVQPEANVTISSNGEVKADGESVGFLRVVTFENSKHMTYEGESLLVPTGNAGEATQSTEPIEVGALENSNASPVRAVTDLMMATRMFDAMERAISTINGVDKRLVTSVPKAT